VIYWMQTSTVFLLFFFFGKLFAHPRYAMQIQNKPRSTLHNHVYILFKQS
jgi:hypothetical protein